MRNPIYFIAIPVALLFSFCQNEAPKQEKVSEKSVVKDIVLVNKDTIAVEGIPVQEDVFNPDNTFNATASLIAGMPTASKELKGYMDSLVWKQNIGFMDSSWRKLERRRLLKMRTWRDKELASTNKVTKTLFYPFSGPDFLTAYTFFPDVDKYIMLGLEPIGRLPDITKMEEEDASDYMQSLKESLTDIFNKSYFITQHMGKDLQNQKVNGTLPVLSFFIKRTGNEIANIKYVVKINNDSIFEVPYTYNNKENKPFGVHIDIVSKGQAKSIYYFRYDVSDKKFNDTAIFYKYLSQIQGPVTTYIKSASYLLHNSFMSNMRKFVLSHSDHITQDDTGVPFKYFVEKDNWVCKVYGEYQRPVKDFKWLDRQPELQAVFDKDSLNIPKLPFHLGYHWNSNKDVLLVCTKKGKV